jgi:hypothetical protein
MDDFSGDDGAAIPQSLKQRYAQLAAWWVSLNRPADPARLPEPVREVPPP